MDMEEAVMELIVNSGNARSLAMEAVQSARGGDLAKADSLLKEADQTILGAHEMQTELIRSEINGEGVTVSLLMVHAQDHLMNAMTVIDLSKEMIEIIRERN